MNFIKWVRKVTYSDIYLSKLPESMSSRWTDPRAPYPPVTIMEPFPSPTAQCEARAEGREGPPVQLNKDYLKYFFI